MPKEKRKRGPRQERLRKRAAQAAEEEQARLKRQRTEDNENGAEEDYMALDEEGPSHAGVDASNATPFYGLLKDEEQEYFRRADEMLETNQFSSAEGVCLCMSDSLR